jgi:PAT family beta-lactamase induction signal transducer AmpG
VANCSEASPEERPNSCLKTDAKTLVWVNSTYFAEGLPYMVVRILSTLYFTQLGVREAYLGYLNYLGLPWNIKFMWAPLVDAWFSKKSWQITLQISFGVLTFVLAALSFLAGSAVDESAYLTVIAIIFIVMAFVAATNDIAIDGFYMDAVSTREQQALLSGYRVLSYRLAMVFARSGLVGVVAYTAARLTHASAYYAWSMAFVIAASVISSLAALHAAILPNARRRTEAESGCKTSALKAFTVFTEAFASYLQQPRVALILIFIVLYKLGDELLFSMVTPFLIRELHITTAQYAWLAGVVGAAGTIVGAMTGGWWIKRVGLRRALWPLTLLMNLNLWLYVWLSIAKPDPMTRLGIAIIAAVHGVEQIAAGLGSAALLIFLLSTCAKDYRATHYAIGSAIMSIPGTLLGGVAGGFVEIYGYTSLYVWAFIATIPGMCLIPFVPIKEAE